MAALDTNVLVRYLLHDDDVQFRVAQKLIRSALRSGECLFVPTTVALEVEWVLRSNYSFAKDSIIATLNALLGTVELRFESEAILEIALHLFKKSSADFADCIHIASAHAAGERPFWTFDMKASKVEGAKLLKP
jgi:predicted nucleic-acid-binding protein